VPWLARLEDASKRWPQDPAVAYAAGTLYAQHQLWGKARAALEQAAQAPSLDASSRRQAWRTLAQLAREQGDIARAQHCDHAAAGVD
jgi:HemY protein